MKITEVRLHSVIVPMRPATVHSEGVRDKLCAPDPVSGRSLNFWEFPKWIVELVTDTGAVGLGEPRRGDLGDALRIAGESLVGLAVDDLPGKDFPVLHGDAYESYFIYEAFEMAWLDLLGKARGQPVWQLLGGRGATPVPIDFWMGRCTPDETERRAVAAAQAGFHGVKMKCAVGDPIAERVRAVKRASPGMTVVLDPNERFDTVEGAVAVSRSLEGIEGVTFESPVPQKRLDWYVKLRRRVPQKIALHLTSRADLEAALRAQAADLYNLLGPLVEFVAWARLAQDAGYPVWRGTGMDLGIRDMSSVHAAAAAGCRAPSDIIGHFLREDDLIAEGIMQRAGTLVPPNLPGLGVSLDAASLRRYAACESAPPLPEHTQPGWVESNKSDVPRTQQLS
jgi:L-alanine-DL-glutamate epimerase-like enolase superfamily enzyme